MAGLSLLVMLGTAFAQEPARQETAKAEQKNLREVLSQLKTALTVPGTGWLLLFIGTYKLGESMSDVLYKPFLLKSGFEGPQVALWTGTWGAVASLAGSAAGGWIATRIPLVGALAVTATLRIFPLIGRWLLAAMGPTAGGVIGVTLGEEFFGGALTTAVFAFMMSRVDRRIGAAHFTLLAGMGAGGQDAWRPDRRAAGRQGELELLPGFPPGSGALRGLPLPDPAAAEAQLRIHFAVRPPRTRTAATEAPSAGCAPTSPPGPP